jgi:hypothetical protein
MYKKLCLIIFILVVGMLNLSADKITQNDLKLEKYPVSEKLKSILQNNLGFFADGVGVDPVGKVPYDTILVDKLTHEISVPRKYVHTTEIGEYLNILVILTEYGKKELRNKFLERIQHVLQVMWNAPNWKGLFYWPYDIKDDGGLVPGDGGKTVPVVDNGNMSFALAGVIGAFQDSDNKREIKICKIAQNILDRQVEGWEKLYDKDKKLMTAGWNPVDNKPLGYFIDRKANESRLGTIWAILATANSSNPVPVDAFSTMKLYTNECTLSNGDKLDCILTWDGTIFQILLPAIYVKERVLIPDYSIIENFVQAQLDFININNLPALMSASSSVSDGYASFGVPELSESYVIFHNEPPKTDAGTPHASALSYFIDKLTAEDLLVNLKERYPQIETPYGWYDAVNDKGETCTKLLSLDQGMFVLALFGDVTADYVEKYLKNKCYEEKIQEIYKGFVPDIRQKIKGL